MKKICIVTGTRAEYGLLKPVIRRVDNDEELELSLYVTGAHLSPEFGMTYKEIEGDGFPISRKIEMLLSADTPASVLKSMGVELMGFADALTEDQPDMMVLLGDRYEILVAAVAAMIHQIPIAHIHGGELTEGLIDDAIRHSVTKMSYLHFVSTEEYRKRIVQLGEYPDRVFTVGSLGVECIKKIPLMDKESLEKDLDVTLNGAVALVTFHPVTLEENSSKEEFSNLLKALDAFPELFIVITNANADTYGRIINDIIKEYVVQNSHRCKCFASLGQLRYLSLLQYCRIVIGNSSSGIIEVPSFKIPTVNIGIRQKGRLHPQSVIDCGVSTEEISDAIRIGLGEKMQNKLKYMENPYQKENTSKTIFDIIKKVVYEKIEIAKSFYDLEV